MPISEAHVGRVYPPTEPYPVTRGKITEFAAALGDTSAPYAGSDAVAPPTFAAILGARAWDALFTDPDLDLELKRTVHVDQRFTWERPLRVGDEVRAQLTIDKVRLRGAAAFVTVTVELTDAHAAVIGTAVSTLLHTWPSEVPA